MSIIQRFKRTRQYLKSTLEYIQQDNHEVIIPHASEINDEGYIIRKSDVYVKQNKAMFCICAYTRFEDNYGGDVTVPVIVTDNLYDELSDNAKQFIILHELGHYNLQIDKILIQTHYKRNLNDEFQADEYALSKMGSEKIIQALKEMKDVVMLPEVSLEIRKRIKNIKQKEGGKEYK